MSTSLRILFMGTPDFAVPTLEALLAGPHRVVAVVCQADKPRGRGQHLSPPPIKELALKAGLPVLQPVKIRTEAFLEEIRALAPELIVVAAYGKILPGALLHLPRLGAINVHGSLLPRYRGAAPIQWAVINGEVETGVTIMQMDEGMDTGDILHTAAIPIGPEETAGSLFTRLARLGGQTLPEIIEGLIAGTLVPRRQDERLASAAPMLKKEQGHLDWTREARTLHNLIRGLDPWPSAYAFFQGIRMRLFAPEVLAGVAEDPPGTILRADRDGLVVATGADRLRIREIQPEGKRRMSVADCLNGLAIQPGQRFS